MRNVRISVEMNGLDFIDMEVVDDILSNTVSQIEDYLEFLKKLENEESEED